ncbi:hypothetical protein, partial [Acidomonas methanolica]|uniref:hypothetical protein n=1 Tax=Acidomonas methanolica TaxID=437 RepID=UPI00211A8949
APLSPIRQHEFFESAILPETEAPQGISDRFTPIPGRRTQHKSFEIFLFPAAKMGRAPVEPPIVSTG